MLRFGFGFAFLVWPVSLDLRLGYRSFTVTFRRQETVAGNADLAKNKHQNQNKNHRGSRWKGLGLVWLGLLPPPPGCLISTI